MSAPAKSPFAMIALLAMAAWAGGVAGGAEVRPGDQDEGRRAFNRSCRACHQVEAGAGSQLGPNLAGLAGRAAPIDPQFGYSAAFRAAATQGLVWDGATLDSFLAGPTRLIPGSSMPMSIADAAQRRDLVAYLASLKP